MKNTLKIVFCFYLVLLYSCNNTKQGELEFVSLERTNGKRLIERFDSTKGYYYYGETVFVKNPPENKGYDLENMMLYYLSKYGIDFSKIDINKYIITFMEYNSDTEVYLTQDYRNIWNGVTN